jgi:hypothetical protein
MTKRILLIFCLFASLILPAAAATKTKAKSSRHAVSRGKRSKSTRKSTRVGSKSGRRASKSRAPRANKK